MIPSLLRRLFLITAGCCFGILREANAAPGDLDASFGTGGKVATSIGSGSSYDEAFGVALQSDGKIVVAGYSFTGSNEDFSVVRYNANGTLDTSFNGTGKVTTAIGSGSDVGQSVVMQSDGKIVVAGYSWNGSNEDFAVVRYNANGSLDTNFNGTGKVTTSIGSSADKGRSVVVQSDGKIVVAGLTANFNGHFALVRYNANGTLDTSFNGTGKVTTALISSEGAKSVALQSDGKIVVAGSVFNGTNYDFALLRYDTNGTLDTSFGGTGSVATPMGNGADGGNSVAVQSNGKILVAGEAFNGSNHDFALARYNTNGTLDTTFNGTGKVITPVGVSRDIGHSMAVQSDGKIVVAGHADVGNYADFALVRYNANGTLDTTFNGTGKVTNPISSHNDEGNGVAVQSDGKIVVAGFGVYGSVDFALARFEGVPPPTTNQTGVVNTTNFYVAPTTGQGEFYNNNGFNITATGYSGLGEQGTGVFNQTGGTHATPVLHVGHFTGSNGTYNHSAGNVAVSGESDIGNLGIGVYDQTGGTHTTALLRLGIGAPGTYRQRGGTLQVNGVVRLGEGAQGAVEHSSGSVTVTSALTLGQNATGVGTYSLSGSGNLATNNTVVGNLGQGTFTQTGGTHTISDSLLLGNTSTGAGTYHANGGAVSGTTLSVGEMGTGTLNINGGALTFTTIKTGAGTKTIVFNQGTVNATHTDLSLGTNGLVVGDGSSTAQLNLGNGTHVANGIHVKPNATLQLGGGTGSAVIAIEGGKLLGHGTLGSVSATTGSVVDPGGAFTIGSVQFAPGVNYQIDLTSSSEWDQLNVTGTVALNGATLTPTLRYPASVGQVFPIIDNSGIEAVSGTFAGLPEGTIFSLINTGSGGGIHTARITYQAAGNDVTITIGAPPSATSAEAEAISATGATMRGSVQAHAFPTSVVFVYSTDPSVVGGLTAPAQNADGMLFTDVSSNVTDLAPGTTYYYYVGATNGAGQNVSAIRSFTTLTLLQQWKLTNYGNANAPDDGDANGNGILNLIEYALGGDPAGNATGLGVLPQVGLSPEDSLQLSFSRFLDHAELTLTVYAADSLDGPWVALARSDAGGTFTVVEPGATAHETGSGNMRSVTVTDLYPVTDSSRPQRFMRLEATR